MNSSNSKDDDGKKNDKFAKNLDQSNVNPVGINNSPPPTSSTNRRENFEPHTLDTGYESHPFFDRLHGYLETNTVYDIWRPNEQEHQTLQHNNSITCLPISAYHQDFNTSDKIR
uniref:Uncharacterized protein n=1 Tax=Panagrolaimus superbus TaxID=310955 RepID=A0A914Y615_9BILA